MKKFDETSRNFGESKNFLSSVFCPLHLIWFEMWCNSIWFIMRALNYDHTAKKSIRYNLLSIFDITVQCHIFGLFNNKNSHKFCRHFSKAWNKLDLLLGRLVFVAHSTAARIELGFNVLFDFNSENWIKESKLKYIYNSGRARYSDDMNQNVSIENF